MLPLGSRPTTVIGLEAAGGTGLTVRAASHGAGPRGYAAAGVSVARGTVTPG